MAALTVEVTIPEELRDRFEARVQAHGGDQGDYLRDLLTRDLNGGSTPPRPMTFDEIFAGAEEGFAESGMTEEQLAKLAEAEVAAYRAERRARQKRSA